MSSLLLQALSVVSLLILGYLFGQLAERRHYRKIVAREADAVHLPVVASRYPPEDGSYHQVLVTGSVVIASDYFKSFLAGLINVFGGQVTPFESLIDRARRESVLRMKDKAGQLHASHVFNVKFETSRIATGRIAAMEVLAYGTALIPLEEIVSNDEI
ncbi:MAG: YbjQ family protein [Granulosicoccus sp.]